MGKKVLVVAVCFLLGLINILPAANRVELSRSEKKIESRKKLPANLATKKKTEYSKTKGIMKTTGEVELFYEDFENNTEGWFTDGGWNNNAGTDSVNVEISHWMLSDAKSNSPTHSMWIDDNFDVSRDALISPPFVLPEMINGDPLVAAKLSYMINIDNPGYLTQGTNFLADFYHVMVGKEATLFHRSGVDPYTGSYSWLCGFPNTAGYHEDNSWQFLTSPEIDLTGATAPVTLTFDEKVVSENHFDLGVVSVSLNDFASIDRDVALLDSNGVWQNVTVDLSDYVGQTIKVRFRFLPDFGYAEPHGGLWVDNISVDDAAAVNYLTDDAEDGSTVMVPFGIDFTEMFYDYDRVEDGGADWWLWDETVIYNGSADLLDFDVAPGDTAYLCFLYRTDGLTEQGELKSAGLFLDDVTVTGISGVPNDAALAWTYVGFPTTSGQVTPVGVDVVNEGFEPASGIGVWYSIDDGAEMPVPPRIDLDAFSDTSRTFQVMMDVPPGQHYVTAWTELSTDENPDNDEFVTDPFVVYQPGFAELGYDDRMTTAYYLPNNQLVHFSPLSQIKGTLAYDIESFRVAFYNAGAADTVLITLALVDPNDPTSVLAELDQFDEIIPASDYSWHTFDQSFNPNARNLHGDFIIMVEFKYVSLYSGVLADAGTPFVGHNFSWSSDKMEWLQSSLGRKMRATISYIDQPDIMSVLDVPHDQGGKVLVSWQASLNDDPLSERPIEYYVVWHKVDPNLFNGTNANVVNVPNMEAFQKYGAAAKANDVVYIGSAKGAAPWAYVDTVPTHSNWGAYSVVASTWRDSSKVLGAYLDYYMVTAYDIYGTYMDSEEGAGYSVDNLKPLAPQGLAAQETADGIMITWEASEDADFDHFALYRSDKAQSLAITGDLFFMDTDVEVTKSYSYKLTALDFSGNESDAAAVTVTVTSVAGTADALPTKFELFRNYPNPFNPISNIKYAVPKTAHVTVRVVNMKGQVVATLVDREMQAGYHNLAWDASNVASGVYFYQMEADNFKATQKMILTK
jgi:hypothetical protein